MLQPRIGAMRESLALQAFTDTKDPATGFVTKAWATFATVSAEYVQPAGGRESWQGAAVTAELGPTFRIRPRTDVEPKHRAIWGSITLQIHVVIPVMAVGRRFLLLQCGYTE